MVALGFIGYSFFMFYLLAKRQDGINYFSSLTSTHNKIVFSSLLIMLILLKICDKYSISESNADTHKDGIIITLIGLVAFFLMGVCYAGLYLFLIVR